MEIHSPIKGLRPVVTWPDGVQAFCSSRQGGVSPFPYGSLNLGDHVQDLIANVQANRNLYKAHIGAKPVFMHQTHGWDLLELTPETPDALTADICITQHAQLACTIMVADCLPVLLADPSGQWVAAAHAGWRGLAGQAGIGVLEVAVQSICDRAACEPEQLKVWLGPCIGPTAFEVGEAVRQAFCHQHAVAEQAFAPGPRVGKWWADLARLARQRLLALGIGEVAGNDSTQPWCTVCQSDLFFSHRRDGVSGRFAASIWRVGPP
ncbi:MAG: peptidoglycan editing factor PgeF [Betaproteobacteria bacterium]|nr:peptidoglycan editing factor PgeF [Betaproteobacteria bacterium]